MALLLNADNVMEHLWGQMDKTPDGEHVHYRTSDIDALWWMGFVDTEHLSIEEWRAAFKPFLQDDGTYILSFEDFCTLDKFRYKGEIRIPFDAMLINEGKYTDEGLQELFDMSIAPSTSLPPRELQKFLDELKGRFRDKDGLIRIANEAKKEIKELLDRFPSPLRNLEIIFDNMLSEDVDEDLMAHMQQVDEAGSATAEVAKQVSRFTSAPTSRGEMQSRKLQSLQQEKPKKKEAAPSTEPEKPTTELKKIRRSRRGMRG